MGDNSNHEARSQLPEESRTSSRAEPTENKMDREGTQNPEAQNPTTMDNSQQPPPAQAGRRPRMRCCQKDSLRDCDCLKPQGPCETPIFIFTHYSHECACYSCEWIREARKKEVPNHLRESSGEIFENCTWAGDKLEKVYNSGATRYCTDLELVYPTLVKTGPPQEWGWVLQSTNLQQLPYLAKRSFCPQSVKMATLDSQGKWKGVRSSGKSVRLVHQLPTWDKLYRDFGYYPKCSPYRYSTDVPRPPDMDPKENSMVPPTKLRQYAADQSNTTLFIGGIDGTVGTDKLRLLFGKYGQIRHWTRPTKTNAFIQFALRRDALMAMRQMQGVPVYNLRFRISWGDPKVINQNKLEVRGETFIVRGNRYRAAPRQPRFVQERQLFDHRQQGQTWAQPARAAPADVVWYRYNHPHGQQQAAQQQMGYVNQLWTVPPPPGSEHRAPSSGPAEPQDARDGDGRPSKLNPRAVPWKQDPKGKGRLVVSSDMVPDPSELQPPHEQPHEIVLAPPPKSPRTDAGSGSDCPSNASTNPSSLVEEGSPKKKAGSDKKKSPYDSEHPGQ